MPASAANSIRLAFGLYEIDLRTGELRKAGFRVKLQTQPFKVLAALLEHPGEIVTRAELQQRVWGSDTAGDFDHSLGTAINKIRDALGDSADNPRFVETLARRGYRFIAPVHEAAASPVAGGGSDASDTVFASELELSGAATRAAVEPGAAGLASATGLDEVQTVMPLPLSAVAEMSVRRRPRPALLWASFAGVLVATAIAVVLALHVSGLRSPARPPHIVQITHNDHLAPTVSSMEGLTASATDGVHLFAATIHNGLPRLVSIALNHGETEPLAISDEVAGPSLGDISPDGSRLLVRSHLSPESEQPLWVVPTVGGSAERVGEVLAHDATWMPDGQRILYASGDEIYQTRLGGGRPELFAKTPGRVFWMRWEPSGKLLRFTTLDPIAHTTSLWQLRASDRQAERILTHSGGPVMDCCGVWLADGSGYVFQSKTGGSTDLWELRGEATDNPVRLTDGPLAFQSPMAARAGRRIYFVGTDARSELERVETAGVLMPERDFLSPAVRVDVSRDGAWIAWTDVAGLLWRARRDGSDKLQLTADTLEVFLAHWSPDGSRLAAMARESGKAWQIYSIDARGGEPKPLLREARNAADPSWSKDGQEIVFGRVNDFMGKEGLARTLEILHLKDGSVTEVPDSGGLFSPRWSPDGRYIAALSLDQRRVRLFDVGAVRWTTLPVSSGADPVWSADSRSLFVHVSMDPRQPIDRIRIPEMRVEELVQLASSAGNDPVDFVFVGLGADGAPLIRLRSYTGNMYSLDLR